MAKGGDKGFSVERQQREDMQLLVQRPEFIRFLWRVIQTARIFDRTKADGSEGRLLEIEGARNLGLEILEMVEAGQPVPHPDGLPILTLIQTFREEATKQQPGEKSHERYDRTAELNDDDDDDA